jgi:uncharacterized protein
LIYTPQSTQAQGADTPAAAPVDSLKVRAIRELIERTHAVDQALRAMENSLVTQRQAMPQVPPEFWDRFIKRAHETRGEFEQVLIGVYARIFTTEEIRQLIAFYGTPIGMRLIEVLPTLSQESMKAGAEWGGRLGVQVGEEMVAERGGDKP